MADPVKKCAEDNGSFQGVENIPEDTDDEIRFSAFLSCRKQNII